jgi:hypothetical protein
MMRLLVSSCLVAAALLSVGCSVQLGGTQERRLVTFDGIANDRATKLAQGYATSEQLAKLRQAAKGQFPKLTDADLQSMGLRWQVMALQDGQHVMLEVTFMPKQSGVDAKAVADYLEDVVRRDIRAMLVQPGS